MSNRLYMLTLQLLLCLSWCCTRMLGLGIEMNGAVSIVKMLVIHWEKQASKNKYNHLLATLEVGGGGKYYRRRISQPTFLGEVNNS